MNLSDKLYLYIMFVSVLGFLFYICILLIGISNKLDKKRSSGSDDYRHRLD